MRRLRILPFLLFVCGCFSISQAGVVYNIAMNTGPLTGHAAAPFSVEFQLNDGSGTGDGNNMANVAAFRRGGDARSIPRIRIPGEHTRDRNMLVGKLAEILNDKRPGRKVAAMFLDMAFGSLQRAWSVDAMRPYTSGCDKAIH
jgi:hypothetical protein